MVALIFCVTDFFIRFPLYTEENADSLVLSEADILEDYWIFSDDHYSDYMTKLTKPENKSQADTKRALSSEIDSNKAPKRKSFTGNAVWNSANHSFRLLAIFDAQEKFAVLHMMDSQTGDKEVLEVYEGDELDGFLMEKIFLQSVYFVAPNNRKVELALFKSPQYETTDSSLGADL